MTALPPASDFTGAAVTEAEFKTATTNQRAYLAGLMGADGTIATAKGTLLIAAADVVDFATAVAADATVAANTAKVTNATHSGDVTGDTALTIADEAVTLAKLAHMATASFLGRNTAATGDPEVLSKATALAMLNVEDGADVTDTANVTSAGALMDTEVDADIKTLVLPASTTISTFGASLVDDTNAASALATLGISSVALLDVEQVWTAAQQADETALVSTAAAISIELSDSNDFTHTFTENTTLSNPATTPVVGQSGFIIFTQHASSPKTLAYGSSWDTAGGTAITVTATNSAVDVLAYKVISTTKILLTAALDVK